MDDQRLIRSQLVKTLQWRDAHVNLDDVLEVVDQQSWGRRVDPIPYTLWELLEHLRISQWDIVEFCLNPEHKSPPFPRGYWPKGSVPAGLAEWERSVAQFRVDLQRMIDLILDPRTDLFRPFSYGGGQTLLREALLLADHNAYHVGQMVIICRLLGIWPRQSPLPSL